MRQMSIINERQPPKRLCMYTVKFVEKYEISKKTVKGIVKG